MELIGTKDAKAIMKYIWSESTIFDARKLDVDNLPTIEPGTIVVMDDLFAEYQSLVDGSNKPSEDELSKLREFIMSVHETPGVMCLITTNYTQNEISEALKSSSADTGNRAASRATSLVRPWIASADTPNRRDIEGAALEDLFE